ncbi:MAG: TAXI family TRAP transporter solute-binding subunit [Sphingomonadales bacterium]|nr:TAXI family TRAP transporter solute-binding subunit [Sphingomonadales bacterium]
MNKCWIAVFALLGLSMVALFAPPVHAEEQRYITIGTGGVTGVYYPAGGAICRLVNRARKSHGIRCSVESTSGSADNISQIRSGELVLGIAQSDVQVSALRGSEAFSRSGAFSDLRSLFSMHSELIHIVARADSGINIFSDLKGKRVNIGNLGSGHRATTELMMSYLGWTNETFSVALELYSAEQSQALCDDQVDAIVFTAGIPNASVKEATARCDAILVPVNAEWVDGFVALNTAYATASIPAETYRGTPKDTPTIGLKAVVLTSTIMPDVVAYEIVKAVFEKFDSFKKFHPAFEHLDKKSMVTDGISAPLHPGALKYFKEAGLLP